MPPHEMIAGRSWHVEFGVVICEFGQKCGESSEGIGEVLVRCLEGMQRKIHGSAQ